MWLCMVVLVCVFVSVCMLYTIRSVNLSMHSSAFVCVCVQGCDCVLRCDCTVSLSGFVCRRMCMFACASCVCVCVRTRACDAREMAEPSKISQARQR